MAKANDVIVEDLNKLRYKTVSGVMFDGDETYGLIFADGTLAWIMCDAEGNGPGHLDIRVKR